MPHIILLGTGTGVPDADRENTHMVWDGPGGPLLIDAGGSTYQRLLRAGLNPQQLQGIFLTHTHCDHINGLAGLLFSMRLAGRTDPLPIYGLVPTLQLVQAILAAFALEKYQPPIIWNELSSGQEIDLSEGWRIQTAMTAHSRPCLALKIVGPGQNEQLTYSADTEPCADVAALAQGSSVLIHEATTPTPFPGHTSPRQAGEVALAAGAKRLILVHYSPQWTMPEDAAHAEIRASGYSGVAEIGREYQVVEI
ncbi:beta-lactamase domain-containing protein [Oscillochloris trichoides DG-6]|uniref:Beta-lactamase domain-containing protein n=1 Tax=Oscillochloris trichoides DG-6 TaxID=765420 RepID=E1IEG3_9CHLR|nr:MBL fold metallo-hydrolase [Oscillochloris trichoides]EFO80489.1 beta-lactamase domain-containing protein [Oscillochloris trichoides DG-6]